MQRTFAFLATMKAPKNAAKGLVYKVELPHRAVAVSLRGIKQTYIAKMLGISYETVKEHVQHILRKIGVSDRTQAAVWAVRKNLV